MAISKDTAKGAYLGCYETSRKRYLKYALPLTASVMFVCGLLLFFLESETRTIAAAIFCGFFYTPLLLSIFHGKYFHTKFKLEAYENGIDFMKIGFFPWKDIFFYYHGKHSMIVFRNGAKRNPDLSWPTYLKASSIDYFEQFDGKEQGLPQAHAAFWLPMPGCATNIALADFVQLLAPCTKIYTPSDFIDVSAKNPNRQIT